MQRHRGRSAIACLTGTINGSQISSARWTNWNAPKEASTVSAVRLPPYLSELTCVLGPGNALHVHRLVSMIGAFLVEIDVLPDDLHLRLQLPTIPKVKRVAAFAATERLIMNRSAIDTAKMQ